MIWPFVIRLKTQRERNIERWNREAKKEHDKMRPLAEAELARYMAGLKERAAHRVSLENGWTRLQSK